MTQATATVSQYMIDRCDRYINAATKQVFYLVESMSNPGTHYRVFYNRQFGVLQCAPHDGEACPASASGLMCWHKRAALAAEAEYKDLKRAERIAAARIAEASRPASEVKAEATIESLVRGGLDRESAIRVANAKPAPVNRRARGYATRPGFSLMA